MKPRAAKDLGQLSDPDFFRAVSEGLSLVIENATRLHDAAQTLRDAKHAQGTHVLTMLAEEEAAKFLILIDAVRCPLGLAKIRTRQLGYFHNHLARGIYAQLVKYHRRVSLAELERIADSDRESLFLDGPNDVDWIFRNTILARREDAIYVDYVEADDGHQRLAPLNIMFPSFIMTPRALTISQALHKTGMTTSDGLEVVAKIWRPVKGHPELPSDDVEAKIKATLEELDRKGLLNPDCGDAYREVVQHWPMPLYTLDLSEKKVDRKKLAEIRERWLPDY